MVHSWLSVEKPYVAKGCPLFTPYRSLLALPGTRAFILAGVIGRFPLSMLGLGSVLLITITTGSYGIAGIVSATLALSNAAVAPIVGRLSDAHGQSRVVLPVLAVHAVGVVGLATAVLSHAPTLTYIPAAMVAGASVPPIGSMVRRRWTALVGGTPQLNTALSLESTLDETVFVIGPVAATLLATTVWAAAGVAIELVLALIGGLAFAAQRETEPAPRPKTQERQVRAISVRGLRVLVGTFVAVGAIFGTVDISMVAFASQHGSRAASGPILAVFATGSLLAGFWTGAVKWRLPLRRRFLRGVICLSIGTIPIVLAPNIPVMLLAGLMIGITISPTIVAGMGLVEELVPSSALTEGFAWVSTALGVGVAIGASIAGRVVDATSGHRAFILATGYATIAATVAILSQRKLVRVTPDEMLAAACEQPLVGPPEEPSIHPGVVREARD
jgi:MFS family permease